MLKADLIFQIKHFLRYNFAFWVLLAFVSLIQSYSTSLQNLVEFNWQKTIHSPISIFLCYWIFSFILIQLYISTRSLNRNFLFPLHLFVSFIFGFLHKGLSDIVALLFERLFLTQEVYTWQEILARWEITYLNSIDGVVIYWLTILLLFALDIYNRYKNQTDQNIELESLLVQNELQTLKMQLQPHFLFNALNTIAMMVRGKKEKEAINMLSGLSDMLRSSLTKKSKQFVTFEEELELTKKYLAIESVRYQDVLQLELDISQDTLALKVPNLVLQPIVENAFKHGISQSIGEAKLKISSKIQNQQLKLSVYNDASSLPESWELNSSQGIGLKNTVNRLRQLYKGHFKFTIYEMYEGVMVEMLLPLSSSKF